MYKHEIPPSLWFLIRSVKVQAESWRNQVCSWASWAPAHNKIFIWRRFKTLLNTQLMSGMFSKGERDVFWVVLVLTSDLHQHSGRLPTTNLPQGRGLWQWPACLWWHPEAIIYIRDNSVIYFFNFEFQSWNVLSGFDAILNVLKNLNFICFNILLRNIAFISKALQLILLI